MPYIDDDGEVECGHGDESFCEDCGGCLECSNCYCDEGSDVDDDYMDFSGDSLADA